MRAVDDFVRYHGASQEISESDGLARMAAAVRRFALIGNPLQKEKNMGGLFMC